MKRLIALAACASLFGCASVVNDSTHPMKVETLTSDGKTIAGAECKLGNDYGSITVKSGDTLRFAALPRTWISPARRMNNRMPEAG